MNLRNLIFTVLLFIISCQVNTDKTSVNNSVDFTILKTDTVSSNVLKSNGGNKSGTGTFEFVRYDDNYDYFFIEVKDRKELRRFIVDEFDDTKFLRGDSIEVEWKQDTIYIGGDGEKPELADCLISVRKTREGKVSLFRKQYPFPLRYLVDDTTKYADSFKDRVYLLVEYYIANSNNPIIKLILEKKQPILIYSIEENERDGRKYYMIGIGENSKERFNYFQWLFIDAENDKLYEYDLPNDKLVAFNGAKL